MVVEIKYNIVEAHNLIAELEDKIERLQNQSDSYLEGLRDYAESDWWRQEEYAPKNLEDYINDAEKSYTLEDSNS